jgi:hypothetical protein
MKIFIQLFKKAKLAALSLRRRSAKRDFFIYFSITACPLSLAEGI